jgi:hypothetical protein
MHDFTINDLLEHRGIDLRHTRLVRHDMRGLAEWRLGVSFFDHFASYQRDDNRTPYNKAKIAIQFVPHSLSGALFVGAHDILDEWRASGQPDYGQNYYWKTHLIKELPDAAIEALVARYRSVPNSKSMIVLQQFGGAVRDIGEADTAFVNRDAEFDFIPAAVWHDGDESAVLIDWVRGTWSAMRPYSRGVYMNGLGGADDERQDEAFGANEIRLRQIKARYDPTNFFSLNANIIPAPVA